MYLAFLSPCISVCTGFNCNMLILRPPKFRVVNCGYKGLISVNIYVLHAHVRSVVLTMSV